MRAVYQEETMAGLIEEATSTLSEKAHTFLADVRFAVLATINPSGTPQLTTMWYGLDGDEVLMNTKIGRAKDLNLSRDPRASFCVEDGYRFVTVSGTARLVRDQMIAHDDIRQLAIRYRGLEGAEQMMRDLFSKEQLVSIRINIKRVFQRL
jgi:PPOX class probable F420-dependent enzyme